MNRKFLFSLLSLVVIASMLLTGCTTPTPKPTEEITLRWRTRPDNQAEIDVYQKASDTIQAEMDGIKLVYEPGGSESSSYQDVLKTEIGAGTAPDVFWIPGTDVAEFATRGLILNMNDLAKKTLGFQGSRFLSWPDVPPDLQS